MKNGLYVVESNDMNFVGFPEDVDLKQPFYHRCQTPETKSCRLCGRRLVRKFVETRCEPNNHMVHIYDYECYRYSKRNPFTWLHSGKTQDCDC